ncbi:MAG: hypothetical protein PHH60_05785 [Candidatus Margulisbacteria bacterium]|nr:hypothetical protein [Candidatus Margulisiibacteriota bacterium]
MVVTGMEIRPLSRSGQSALKAGPINTRQLVARYNRYAAPNMLPTFAAFGMTNIILLGTAGVTKRREIALVAIFAMINTAREVISACRVPAEKRENLSRGGLIARTAGVLLAGGGFITGLALTAMHAVTPLAQATILPALAIGLVTLAVEKIVRMVKERSSFRNLKESTTSAKIAQQVAQAIKDNDLSQRVQIKLLRKWSREVVSREELGVLLSVANELDAKVKKSVSHQLAKRAAKCGDYSLAASLRAA